MPVSNLTRLISINQTLICIAVLSPVILGLSYFMQYILGYEPCRLCVAQRAPYFLTLATSLCGVFSTKKNAVLLLIVVYFSALLLLSSYHVLIQLGFMPDHCATNAPATIESFKSNLFKPRIPCATTSWSILGISPSTMNAVISIFFIILLIRVRRSICGFTSK
jgi:disulfide bond formation protein DsbB